MRQRSTTTITPEDRSIETTTKDNYEESRENKYTKVSYEAFTTEASVISTTLFNTEPFTEITTTTINVPIPTATKSGESTKILTSNTEKNIDILSTTKASMPIVRNISSTPSTTKAPTSTITNVITSIYEAATERQRVRVKNISNFLLEHKKTEPVTQSIAHTAPTPLKTISSTTVENVIAVEESTPKSIFRGRFGGQTHYRPILRKPIGTLEKNVTTTDKVNETTTERISETSTEKKSRLNKYTNRFVKTPAINVNNTENTSKRFVRTTTEKALESSSKQFNRYKSTINTTSSDTENNDNSSLTRRHFSRFRPITSETPLTSSTELQKSRFFRSRKLISSTSTSTTATEVTTTKEQLSSVVNADTVRYEPTTHTPSTSRFSTTGFEATSMDDEEFQTTTVDGFEPTKYSANEIITTVPPVVTTRKTAKAHRGAVVRGGNNNNNNNAFNKDGVNENSRQQPSSGRQNSRFLKDEQKILYIRVLPPPDGRSHNEFASSAVKNVSRRINRGRIRAFDSLELDNLSGGSAAANRDRPNNELFRGSETNFRVRQTTAAESTEEVWNDICITS